MSRARVKIDTTKWFEAMDSWSSMCRYQASKKISKADTMYYELYTKYYERLKPAIEEGKIVVHPTSVPTEIIYSLGLTPLLITSSTWQMAYSLKNFQECFDIAKEGGIMETTCSPHRIIAAFAFKGWFPSPIAFVFATGGCDAFCGSSRVLSEYYSIPSFCIDTPYHYNEEGYAYLTQELADMVQFLEEHSGRKMDWDRLRESLKKSKRQYELFQEIRELRKAIPSPMENRTAWQLNWMNWIWAGSDEGITFFETLRDELKERVEKGVTPAIPGERLRLLDLFMPPTPYFRLLDWMQKERGVNIVSEGLIRYEGGLEFDLDKPLRTLALKWCHGPLWNELSGSTELIVEAALKDAKEYKVDGAIWWDLNTCRQCGAVRMTKDALADELGIPVAEPTCDIGDPNFVTYEEVRDKLADFFDVLEARY